MVKQKPLTVLALALLLLGLVSSGAAAAAPATIVPFEGDFVPSGIVSMGVWTYPGGNMHVHGMVATYEQIMSEPLCSGTNTVVTYASWDAMGVGPSHGTFRVVLYDDPTSGWEGIWTGMSYAEGASAIMVVGKGYGNLLGMKVFVDIEFADLYSPGVASGYMLGPQDG